MQSKTSSDSNKFFIFDKPIHWLAKSIALIEQDLSPGIFTFLLNFSIFLFIETENFLFIILVI